MKSSKKRILVTGASGFIGSHLCQKLLLLGHELVAINRSGSSVNGAMQTLSWCFGQLVPKELLVCDVAIHLAHDFSGEVGAELTISGTKELVTHLYAHGTRRQLFITSYSAGQHARSRYGKTKDVLENALRMDKRTIIVRPGLVLGDGGIYGKIVRFIYKSPIVPLPDGGSGYVTVITIERLCDEIARLCTASNPEQFANIFELQEVTLKNLVKKIASEVERHPLFVSVPISLVLPIIRILESLKIPLPVSSDSLIGFLDNQTAVHVSTLKDRNESV